MFLTARLSPGLILSLLSLLSAFLLFQVQPMISKFILPWFGGSPGVWTTCMLFFQVVLFAGYAYAHALTRLPGRWQLIVHGLLLLGALVWLPIVPADTWKPMDGADPVSRILLLLAASVGLPYLVLSSTAPLVQVWFTRAYPDGTNPWRLYALSNLGSLTALLSYPVFFEPRWDVIEQTHGWSVAFALFVFLCLFCVWRNRQVINACAQVTEVPADTSPKWWTRALWLLLPAVASAMLLATTNHVCQDVAVIPFLWVVPLALYLLSFILCFEHERWYVRVAGVWALPALLLVFIACTESHLADAVGWQALGKQLHTWIPALPETLTLAPNYLWQLGWAFGALFFICMLCHGELTRLRPAAHRLTEFYLYISAGGALGGLFVSLGAPRWFVTYAEWPTLLIVGFLLAVMVLTRAAWQRRWRLAPLFPIAVAGIWCMVMLGFGAKERLVRVRNFYGAMAVEEGWDEGLKMKFRRFTHGRIFHGTQNMGAPLHLDPSGYYSHPTGIGKALDSLRYSNARVGVVGLGVGTVASYAHLGHVFRFYEIDPEVERIATRDFTYLGDAEERGAEIEIVIADGRLALEREPPQHFDVLVLDAFSGDSVPVHLLTLDAFQIYLRHLKPDGIIVVQISNKFLRLAPVIEKIAAEISMTAIRSINTGKGCIYDSEYVLLTRNKAFLRATPSSPVPASQMQQENSMHPPVWTDRRHNLFEVMRLQ